MKRLAAALRGGILLQNTSGAARANGTPALDFIGFDLGQVASQMCLSTAEGERLEHRRQTDREQLAKLLGARPPARILIDAGTESAWVARYLAALGHEGVAAFPNDSAADPRGANLAPVTEMSPYR